MRAARRLGFGLELVADDPVHGTVGEVDGVGGRQVLLNLAVAAKAVRLVQPSLQLGQYCGGQCTASARGLLNGQERAEPAFLIGCEPRPHGVAMDR